jgi:hypothetical protein
MSGLEDELEQKGKEELKEKVDSELGGSQAGDQQGADRDDQSKGGDPNANQDPGAGDPSQSQSGS